MKGLNAAAGQRIFEERNKQQVSDVSSLCWPSEDASVLDLHGLHIQEAVQVLREKLSTYRGSELYVITGTGHHSVNKKVNKNARLQPAIQRFLDESNFTYWDASTDGRGGMLRIQLGNSKK